MMKKLARLTIFTFLLTITLNLGLLQHVSAVNGNPSSGTVTANTNVVVNLTSTQVADAIELRLEITNGTIIGYNYTSQPPNLPACSGDVVFTASLLCTDIATNQPMSPGTSLGSVTIRTGSSGVTTLTKQSNNRYLSTGDQPITDTGTLATFTIGSVTTLPATGIFDNGLLGTKTLIYIGSISLTTGIFLLGRKYYLLD